MDRSEFKLIFESHYSSLCNLSYRFVGDIDKAEDVVQDVFVKIWDDRKNIDTSRNVKSLIYTMVKNHSLEILRRDGIGAKIKQSMILPDSHDPFLIDEDMIEKYLLLDQIYVSIRQLPPKCGHIFTLSKVNGLTYVQIAGQLNISVKTVENHIGKALKLLREMMSKNLNKE